MKYFLLSVTVMALALTACAPTNVSTPAASTAAPTSVALPATSAPEATSSDVMTSTATTADSTPTADATVLTDTLPLTDTMAMTDTMTMTDTTMMTETAPMTDTMAMTDTMTMTDTLPMTGTMDMTGTVPMTDSMAMTDTMTMTDTLPMTSTMSEPITATSAMADLQDADGNIVGMARFTDTEEGLEVTVNVSGFVTATAGEHGIHIHQVGACTPDFAAAGAHYNPTVHKHGTENPDGPHAGDLENIVFDEDGNASYTATNESLVLSGPVSASLLGADGSAIVIHTDPDDYETDPSGRSGGRILCGVLMAEGVEPPVASGEPPPPGGTLNSPNQRVATPENIAGLQVPAGFTVTVFARGLDNARILAQHENGTIYVTRRAQGDVIALRDENGDGEAEPFIVAATDLEQVQGIIITGDRVYLGTPTTIYIGSIQADGTFAGLEPFVTGLPDADQHANAMIAFGADGNLYVTIGSSCNACNESNPENAAMLQILPDGSRRTIYAEGLRNTLGWGWHPETGELWGFDHGSDWRGDDQPPEELNKIEQDKNYGWPHCYGDKQIDRYLSVPPPGATKAEFCAASTGPALSYQAHSAPIAMVFYTGDQFPDTYQNGAFVAMRGSWNRAQPSGYKVVHVRFEDGQPTEVSDFLTGFLIENDTAMFGRPAGLLVLPDGSLLVTDDTNGMIYQIAYVGE